LEQRIDRSVNPLESRRLIRRPTSSEPARTIDPQLALDRRVEALGVELEDANFVPRENVAGVVRRASVCGSGVAAVTVEARSETPSAIGQFRGERTC
jgi:hypothetical protein